MASHQLIRWSRQKPLSARRTICTSGQAAREPRDDAAEVFEQPGGGVDVGRPQQGQQRMIAAEDVQGQVAECVVVAVKETSQLVAVQGDVGGVQVQDDALRGDDELRQEGLDEEALHGVGVGHDLLVAARAAGADGGEFEAVEGALAGQGFARSRARGRSWPEGSVLPTRTARRGSRRRRSWSLRSS